MNLRGTSSPYHEAIEASLRRQGMSHHDPRLIEAWMRVEHATLDGLSHLEFDDEVREAAACVKAEPEISKQLAECCGL